MLARRNSGPRRLASTGWFRQAQPPSQRRGGGGGFASPEKLFIFRFGGFAAKT
ncbi:hypothetical protein [Candidatus Viridilinea mediisalina]|uniref:hypothetical protein n=1 Tax=Candidatus Viridilinea mediisalina TaxID=2024553 RepID=UPI0013FDC6B7|nr:hypothetical protein [Candidatus Viridilinea mediisalina]